MVTNYVVILYFYIHTFQDYLYFLQVGFAINASIILMIGIVTFFSKIAFNFTAFILHKPSTVYNAVLTRFVYIYIYCQTVIFRFKANVALISIFKNIQN